MMATAKRARKKLKIVPPDFTIDEGTPKRRIPFLEDESTPVVYSDDFGLDDPDMGLAKEFTNHALYDTPISAELQAIIDDPVRCLKFCEETSLDPEMVAQYESGNGEVR